MKVARDIAPTVTILATNSFSLTILTLLTTFSHPQDFSGYFELRNKLTLGNRLRKMES